jgi:hypothetical protein
VETIHLARRGNTPNVSAIASTKVYFRPEIQLLYDISDRDSTFWAKIHLVYYWSDPALSYTALKFFQGVHFEFWTPHLAVLESLYAEVLEPMQVNVVAETVVAYHISNSRLWSMDEFV